MKDTMKVILAGLFVLSLSLLVIYGAIHFSNKVERMKYEFLNERGHNVAYIDDSLLHQCVYKKSYGFMDCAYEYTNEVWKERFVNSNKEVNN